MMRRVAVLGSTGSIGTTALKVLARHRDRFAVSALTAHGNTNLLAAQAAEWRPAFTGLVAPNGSRPPADWATGPGALVNAAIRADVDIVLNAVVGVAGMDATLAALGFTKPGRAGITQVLGSAATFTDAATGASADAATTLANLVMDGTSMALATGDRIAIGGTSGDGSTVSKSFTVTATSTVGDLLSAINGSESGYGANSRAANAAISAGQLTLTQTLNRQRLRKRLLHASAAIAVVVLAAVIAPAPRWVVWVSEPSVTVPRITSPSSRRRSAVRERAIRRIPVGVGLASG